MISVVTDFLWCVVGFLQTYNGAVTALATAAIGFFTYFLVRVTNRQAVLTRESINLARQEFVSTHRPKIIVYGMNFVSSQKKDKSVAVSFRYVNAGESDATIVDIGTKLIHLFKPTMPSDIDFVSREMAVKVPSGNHGFFITEDTVSADSPRLLNALLNAEKLVCVGYIVYEDDNGTRRQMGFCREYDPPSNRWRSMKDDDYEYAY